MTQRGQENEPTPHGQSEIDRLKKGAKGMITLSQRLCHGSEGRRSQNSLSTSQNSVWPTPSPSYQFFWQSLPRHSMGQPVAGSVGKRGACHL